MSKAPILISVITLILQFVLISIPRLRLSIRRVISSGLYLVHGACGVASLALLLEANNGSSFLWTVKWFQFSEHIVFHLSFLVEVWSSILWAMAGLYLFLEKYFRVMANNTSSKSISLSRAVTSFGVFLSIISGNFITFYFGWSLIGLGQFLGVAFCGASHNDEDVAVANSNQSARLYATTLVCDLILLLGILGLTSELGYATFSDIKSAHGMGWYSVAVIFGLSGRFFIVPLLGLSRYLVSGGVLLVPNLLLGSVLISGVFFTKMTGVNYGHTATMAILIVSCITALVAATKALSENSLSKIIGWLSAYFCVSALLSYFSGSYVSVHFGVIGSMVALWLLYVANEFMPQNSFASRALEVFSGIMLLAPPMTMLGQARYFDYANIINLSQNNTPLLGLVFLKGVADILVAILGWKIIKGHYRDKKIPKLKSSEATWMHYTPAMATVLMGLSPIMGGRVFSGWLGELEEGPLGATMWLERALASSETAIAQAPIDPDLFVIARFICIGIFTLAALLALVWLERDHKTSTESFKRWRAVAKVVNVDGAFDYIIWILLGQKALKPLTQFVANVDQRTSYYFELGVSGIVSVFSRIFRFVDNCLVDSVFLNAPHKVFVQISVVVRRMHGGGVIYMLGFALLLTALSLLRFYMIEGK